MSVVAIIGASRVQGREVIDVLADVGTDWITELRLVGDPGDGFVRVGGRDLDLQPWSAEAFAGVDIAIGGGQRELDLGAVVVSVLDGPLPKDDVLVLPGLNSQDIEEHRGRVFVPDGAGAAMALIASQAASGLTGVSATILHPVSRMGPPALEELYAQTVAMYRHEPLPTEVLGDRLAYNVLTAPTVLTAPASALGLSRLLPGAVTVQTTDLLVPLYGGTVLVIDLFGASVSPVERPDLSWGDPAQPAEIVGQTEVRAHLGADGRVIACVDEVRQVAKSLVQAAREIHARDAF